MQDPSLTQLLSHDPRQGIIPGLADIGNAEAIGGKPVSRTQGAYDGNIQDMRGLDQVQLAGDDIDGVQKIIIVPGKESLPGFGRIPFNTGNDKDLRVDILCPFGGNKGFGTAQR